MSMWLSVSKKSDVIVSLDTNQYEFTTSIVLKNVVKCFLVVASLLKWSMILLSRKNVILLNEIA